MQLLIITNCSATKTATPEPILRARTLVKGAPSTLAEEWCTRIRSAKKTVDARHLYAGRGFTLAYKAAQSTGAHLRIVSAGMGLLHPDAAIAPYSLTLSPGTPDCILSRAPRGAAFSAGDWWRALCPSSRPNPFSSLLKSQRRSLLVLAMTSPYLAMISDDLIALSEQDRARLRIVGTSRTHQLPEEIRACVMPYDSRLNDADRGIHGTTFDFPSRALLHFTELVKLDRTISDTTVHARRVRQSLAHWSAPVLDPRIRVGDATLRREIKRLKSRGFSLSAGLRYLRNERCIACEQGRFSYAWKNQ